MFKEISIVIPMYNEAENVFPLFEEIIQACQPFEKFEIVAVDDFSQDATLEQLKQAQLKWPNQITIVRHKVNSGQSASLLTGVKYAQYSWIATLDGDGQNDPADILKMYSCAQEYANEFPALLIAGHRNKRQDNLVKKASSKIANRVRSFMLKDDCPDTGCGLKLFSRTYFLSLPHFNHMHRFMPALFKRQGAKTIMVPVNHRPRLRGQSKYGVFNRLWVGIVDLFGVAWLQRRSCHPQSEQYHA